MSTHIFNFTQALEPLNEAETGALIMQLVSTRRTDLLEKLHDGLCTAPEAQRIIDGKQSWQLIEQHMDKYGLFRGA
jgi:hypothetical protein